MHFSRRPFSSCILSLFMLRCFSAARFFSSFAKGRNIVIVGGVAGGGTAAARLRRLDERANITVYEKGDYNSYANCGLPFFIGGVIPKERSLLVSSPKQFKDFFNIDVKTGHEVLKINRKEKTVLVKDLAQNRTFEAPYDKLILAPGAVPVVPPIQGVNAPGVFTLRDIPDSRQIKAWIDSRSAKRAVVVGGGFIGMEMTENLRKRGLDVTVIERAPHVMPNISGELASVVEDRLQECGVHVYSNHAIREIKTAEDNSLEVVCSDSTSYPCDLVILSMGVRPNSALAKDAGLKLGVKDSIAVDSSLRTSDPDIYAVGDAIQTLDFATKRPRLAPLAAPANRQARIVADVLCGLPSSFRGVQGTSVCGVFDVCVAATGNTAGTLYPPAERVMDRGDAVPAEEVCTVCLHSADHATFFPDAYPIHLNLTFDRRDGRVLGAQAVGVNGVDKRIDVISAYIHMHGTVTDLAQAELCYAPQYGAAKDIVNLAGMVAQNVCRGLFTPVHWEQALAEDSFKLDVRDRRVFEKLPTPGFTNIPLGELRASLPQLPKDRVIDVSCYIGRTSYYTCRILEQEGYKARCITGGWGTYSILPKWLVC